MFKQILQTVKKEKFKVRNNEENPIQDQIQKSVIQQKIFEAKIILDLTLFQVADREIKDVFYIKNYIDNEEHDYILDQIYQNESLWKTLQHAKRRVQKYGGDVKEDGLQNQEPLPDFLLQFSQNFTSYINLPINHVLINEYDRGIGIMNHLDGPLYYGFVNIVSFGSHCVFTFKRQDQILRLLIEPNSLLIFTNQAYTEWQHGIEYFDEDTILLRIQDQIVQESNMSNFFQTGLKESLQQELLRGLTDDIVLYDKDGQIIANLFNLKDNVNYNKALIMKRNKRVSVTLRHVWPAVD